ncbi:MAG: chemotaxis protein CheB [Alphaproteobacteria bacterium]
MSDYIDNDAESAQETARPVLDYPVVGLGASAGGIDALRKFFGALPERPGMAFIVVLHLSPDHRSHLADLLRKVVTLPLTEVEDDTPVAHDHVYVITPKHALTLEGGTIRVNPAGGSPRHPVDTLFHSLAKEQREKAVAVVLSGTGTDGTGGAIRIKEEGGAVFVQDPETAEYDGMPLAVIGAGVADRVLAPETMPQELLNFAAHPYVRAPTEATTLQEGEGSQLNMILTVLRTRARYDFHGYKTTTLLRRIRRRMGLRSLDTLGDYVEVLRNDPAEAEALVRDLLINVTAFFRNHEAWKELDNAVIEPLVRAAGGGEAMRVWVPACSTGEEAYSIAMLLLDRAEAMGKQIDLHVFATDAAAHVLTRARTGLFAASVAEEMPPERLARHFDKRDDYYQARKPLREAIVFAPQKLLHDPPFSRMDLVSCRNMLIYLEPEMQRKVIALLHFSLRENGYLFLGTAETPGEREDLFRTVSKKWRIYRRLGPTRHDIVEFPLAQPGYAPQTKPPAVPVAAHGALERARRALVERFAPPSVLIDGRFHVHYFHGETERFLDPPRGEPTRDLLSLAKRGLRVRLRAAVQRAMRDGGQVTADARVEGPEPVPVRIVVAPLHEEGGPRRLLVSFIEAGAAETPPDATAERLPEHELEDALRASRAELRETVEQLESSNQELQASNEEISSMNEELQSTNEELETSKEELQSLNEELNTVNQQLQNKLGELEEQTSDFANLLGSSNVATLFLDREKRIRFATPAVRELFEVKSSDVGRPVSDLAQKFEDPDFIQDADEVLRTLQLIEREVRTAEGRWFERRIQPYRAEERIDGTVVNFSDITERKRGEEEVAAARMFAEAIVDTVRHPLLVLDPDSWWCRQTMLSAGHSGFLAKRRSVAGSTSWAAACGTCLP